MADFCKRCSTEMFGEDYGDIKAASGCTLTALCEGCGMVTVDDKGDPAVAETSGDEFERECVQPIRELIGSLLEIDPAEGTPEFTMLKSLVSAVSRWEAAKSTTPS